ncbi:MAG: hypothetical protein JKX92_12195 [Porticoccaceae bacterium]|nr:hypothetical protein [Porticoccaceae bacterium]
MSEAKKTTKSASPTAKKAPAGPTPEELQGVHNGGDYLFNPETRTFTSVRKPTKPAPGKQESEEH